MRIFPSASLTAANGWAIASTRRSDHRQKKDPDTFSSPFLLDAQLDNSEQEELGGLLARNREGLLLPMEIQRLDELMDRYRSGLIRKAHALNVAVARGLRPRLNWCPSRCWLTLSTSGFFAGTAP